MKVKRPTGPVDEPDWRYHLNQRLGAEFIAGAEEEWRKRNGRPLTGEELSGCCDVIRGDV